MLPFNLSQTFASGSNDLSFGFLLFFLCAIDCSTESEVTEFYVKYLTFLLPGKGVKSLNCWELNSVPTRKPDLNGYAFTGLKNRRDKRQCGNNGGNHDNSEHRA